MIQMTKTDPNSIRDRALSCMIGLAVGDAVGTTVNFLPRGSFPRVTDMVGAEPVGLLRGYLKCG